MKTKAVCKDLDVVKDLSKRIDSIRNETRLKLLLIVGRETNKSPELRKPTYLRALGHELKDTYGISISLVAIKNHLNKLVEAGLIKKELGLYRDLPVKNHLLIPGALEALSMDINILSNRITDIKDEISRFSYQLPLVKILGGEDDGKLFPLTKESVKIGRQGDVELNDPQFKDDIILSNDYESVSRVYKPHATLKQDNGNWTIEDKNSKCGVYINGDNRRSSSETLKNRDKIRLALGKGGAEMVFISEV